MKEIYQKVKSHTGCSYEAIANVLGCTRQHVALMINQSHKTKIQETSVAYLMEVALDEKIQQLQEQIREIEDLKSQVRSVALMPDWAKNMMKAE